MQKAFSQPFDSSNFNIFYLPVTQVEERKKDKEKPGHAMKITFLALIMLY